MFRRRLRFLGGYLLIPLLPYLLMPIHFSFAYVLLRLVFGILWTDVHAYSLDTKLPGDQLLLTKGDNNYVDDIELYQGLDWLEKKHIVGKVRG